MRKSDTTRKLLQGFIRCNVVLVCRCDMGHYVKKICENCGKSFRELRRCKNKHICYRCHWKEPGTIRIGSSPQQFSEPLDKALVFHTAITKTQHMLLKEKCSKLNLPMARYVRELIVADLYYEQKTT